ncbi:MAG: dipeptidase [Armatimonadota bacterium]|nr:dipeptidase [Armatimonadota bacterium]
MATETAPQQQAEALHRSSIVVDGTTFFCKGYTDRLERAGVTALNTTTAWPDDDFDAAVRRIEEYYALVRDDPKIGIVERADDIVRFKREGKVGIIIAFQNARPVGTSLTRVETFWRLGVRTIQLTYNTKTFVGDGVFEEHDGGLSKFGRALVREMNHVGILVDLSHGGRRTTMEAIEVSEKPCVFTHSNPYNLVPVPRNITDAQMKAVAAKGGVVGCSSFPALVWRGNDAGPTLDEFIDCIDYAVNLVGVDHVAIGTDSEATLGAYPPELRAGLRRQYPGTTGGFHQRFPQGSPLVGLEQGLGDWPNITRRLLERGYAAADVQKIIGGNLMRVFREVWRA